MDNERILAQFIEAWNVDDPDERRRLVESTCEEAVEIVSPYGAHRGIAAQIEEIEQFRKRFPKGRCTAKVVAQHHGWVMDTWTTEFGDGSPALHGVDVSRINEAGRVVQVISFSPVPAP
jgi:SnoaL-like domain